MRPVVVFNPHPWPVRADVELEYAWLREAGAHVVDDEGDAVPMQLTRPLTTMSSARGRLVFPAELPPLGYRTYRVRLGAVDGEPLAATDTRLENEHLLLELDPATGRIARLVLKATGVDLADPDARHAVVVDDPSDTWGHGVLAYDRELGEFECRSVRLVEAGPVRGDRSASTAASARSTLREDYVLGADAPYVDVRVALDWHEQREAAEAPLSRRPSAPSARRSRRRTATSSGRRTATRSRASRGSTSPAGDRGLDRGQRREVRLRRARRRHRHQRRAQPGLGVARPARARGGRRLRVHGPGPAELPRPPDPARRRLARARASCAARPS